jgi:hypothetical protein
VTDKTDEQLTIEANRIRERWMNHDSDPHGATEPARPRPMGVHDIAHHAALNFRNWAPSETDLTREQRGRLRRLRQEIINPDLSGLSGPSDDDLKEFPQLRELQQKVEIARKAPKR